MNISILYLHLKYFLQKVYASMIKLKPLIGMTHRQSVKAVGFGFIVKGQG